MMVMLTVMTMINEDDGDFEGNFLAILIRTPPAQKSQSFPLFLTDFLMALASFRQRTGQRTFRLRVDQLSTKTDQNPPGNKDYEREKKRMMIRAPFSWK